MATPTMDNIKKKMQHMKNEKEQAIDAADKAEESVAALYEKLRLVRHVSYIIIQIKRTVWDLSEIEQIN